MGDDRDVISEALTRVGIMMATDSRDWAIARSDAWLYGLFCGWDDEDSDPSSGDAMSEVAAVHGWSRADVERLRRYRAALRAHLEGK